MSNAGRWIVSGFSMAAFMSVSYGLFLTLAENKTEEVKKQFRVNRDPSEYNNEFARVIYGRGPADLGELKKMTDKRRMELAEKATKYNVPEEKPEE